jgi:hypothetical protein
MLCSGLLNGSVAPVVKVGMRRMELFIFTLEA